MQSEIDNKITSSVHPVIFIKLMSPVAIRPVQQHKWSDIHFISFARNMFRPTITAIIRRYYKNIKGKTDATKVEVSPCTEFWNLIWLILSRPLRLQYYSKLNWLIPSRPLLLQYHSKLIWLFLRSFLFCSTIKPISINPLNAELNPICHLLALLGAHHIFHVSRLRINL